MKAATLTRYFPLWAVMSVGLAGLTGVFAWSRPWARHWGEPPEDTLPAYSELPDFALTDQDGKPVTRSSLLGRVWVADFIFTHCNAACPKMSNTMAAGLQKHLRELEKVYAPAAGVRMVSITVDPVNDTPEVLADYARRYNAGDRWRFLTGDREVIRRLAFDGFKVNSVEDIDNHSTRFMLVDRRGRVRGHYSVVDSGDNGPPPVNGLDKLKHDIGILLQEAP